MNKQDNTWTPERVTQARTKLGLSQIELAEQLGVRQATVSDWETGKSSPSRMAATLLQNALGKSAPKRAQH